MRFCVLSELQISPGALSGVLGISNYIGVQVRFQVLSELQLIIIGVHVLSELQIM